MPDNSISLELAVPSILGFAAIIVAIVVYLKQRKEKKFAYKVLTSTLLLNVNSELDGKIKVLFDEKPITYPRLITVQFICSGQIPIQPSEFHRPITINLNWANRALSAEVTETVPPNPDAQVEVHEKSVVLKPLLLNPGDTLTIKMFLDSYTTAGGIDSELTIEGQVVGISKFENVTTKVLPSREQDKQRLLAFGIMLAVLIVITGFGSNAASLMICLLIPIVFWGTLVAFADFLFSSGIRI